MFEGLAVQKEVGTDRLSQNVGTRVPTYISYVPKKKRPELQCSGNLNSDT
jgi:hypothetical protein